MPIASSLNQFATKYFASLLCRLANSYALFNHIFISFLILLL